MDLDLIIAKSVPAAAVVSYACYGCYFTVASTCHWLSAYYIPGTILSPFYALFHLILTMILSVRNVYVPLPDEEIGSKRLINLPRVAYVVEQGCQFQSL